MFEERYVHFCQPLHFFFRTFFGIGFFGRFLYWPASLCLGCAIIDCRLECFFCISQVLLNTIKSYSRLGQTKNKNYFCTSSNPHAMVLTHIPAFFLPHFSSVSVRQGTEGDDNLDEIYLHTALVSRFHRCGVAAFPSFVSDDNDLFIPLWISIVTRCAPLYRRYPGSNIWVHTKNHYKIRNKSDCKK